MKTITNPNAFLLALCLIIMLIACKEEKEFDYDKYMKPPEASKAPLISSIDEDDMYKDEYTDTESIEEPIKQVATIIDDKLEKTIRAFVEAEDAKEVGDILDFYSFPVARYFDQYHVSREKLSKHYTSAWKGLKYSENNIKSIEKIDDGHYVYQTQFKATTKSNRKVDVLSSVHIYFEDGLIKRVYDK